MITFPVDHPLMQAPIPSIETLLKRAGSQCIELAGTYLCDTISCECKYGDWLDATVIVGERRFAASAQQCEKCNSYNVKVFGEI